MATENSTAEVVAAGVSVLSKVVANIVATPGEAKFRKLKKENKLVAQKLLPCRGALAVVVAAGFRSEDVDGVPCLVMPDESVDVARLQSVQSGLEGVVAAFHEHDDPHEQ